MPNAVWGYTSCAHAPSSQANWITPSTHYSSQDFSKIITSKKAQHGIYGNGKKKDIGLWSNGVRPVLTEFATVNLHGKTLRERGEALISIAHPDFCQELRKALANITHFLMSWSACRAICFVQIDFALDPHGKLL
jgi:hypothetical protein